MCGILGGVQLEVPDLSAMADALRHRGPDDYGLHFEAADRVALAMCRLSIVDIAAGQQPMTNEDGTVWIVFNGEIYNAPALRERLLARGHHFQTHHSDTEVLVHLYEDKSLDMLADLNGMFAFVLYDRVRRRLFAARDRMGIKPLYYTQQAGRFAFASELKALRCLPWLAGEIDRASLNHYASLQFVPAPRTILRDVHKLPAGHFLELALPDNRLSVHRYWRLTPCADTTRSVADWTAAVRAKLEESVKLQTLSDVPIACSLSGGLDSSAVTALLSQCNCGPVRTYSLGFSGAGEEQYDELRLAQAVAQKWGTIHHEVVIEPTRLLADLERMVWHLDEPYGGGLPSWYVFEAIGRDCKVALTGTGGDELFGNYAKWQILERSRTYRLLRSVRDACRWRQPRELADHFRYPHGHFQHRYLSDAVKASYVLDADVEPTEALLESLWDEAGTDDPRDGVAMVDFQCQLPEEFLAMTDRFSMAHSVEARVPFLDHELVELVYRIPSALRTRPGDPKYLLRQIVADLLQAELLAAPKRGFVLPLPLWTRGRLRELIGDLLGPSALRRQGLFAPTLWDKIVAPHLAGRRDWTQQVWTLLMFQLWQQQTTTAARAAAA